MAMNTVTCSLGCEHPACQICGTTDPTAGITHGIWPFGVESPGRPEMTTCLTCRNAVFARIDTVGKIRLLIGLEQRVTVPEPPRPPRPAVPDTFPPPRDPTMNTHPGRTDETLLLPVSSE